MPNNEILNYIKTGLANGENKKEMTDALLSAGWGSGDIQEAIDTFPTVAPSASTVQSVPVQSVSVNAPANKTITEKDYPITTRWILKNPIIVLFLGIIMFLTGDILNSTLAVLAAFIYIFVGYIIRANFHYSLDDKYFHIKQGVISKTQRNLPYGVIQDVFVKQNLLDRIFGIASLRIENASQLGGKSGGKASWLNKSYGMGSYSGRDGVGSSGNKINLPGLKKQDAEVLKKIILQKMKENPIEESGL